MERIYEVLKSIEDRLSGIEQQLSAGMQVKLLEKAWYSCREVAELTAARGVVAYSPFTVRYACNDQRVPEAQKLENGTWSLPRRAVERILREGLPPERRARRASSDRLQSA